MRSVCDRVNQPPYRATTMRGDLEPASLIFFPHRRLKVHLLQLANVPPTFLQLAICFTFVLTFAMSSCDAPKGIPSNLLAFPSLSSSLHALPQATNLQNVSLHPNMYGKLASEAKVHFLHYRTRRSLNIPYSFKRLCREPPPRVLPNRLLILHVQCVYCLHHIATPLTVSFISL